MRTADELLSRYQHVIDSLTIVTGSKGVFDVEVDGETVAEIGPGAIVGERALLEGGVRSATVRARTDARIAIQRVVTADRETLDAIASDHRREEG